MAINFYNIDCVEFMKTKPDGYYDLAIVDPLKVEETMEKLQVEVDEFEVEVDAVLSEINALTEIEI